MSNKYISPEHQIRNIMNRKRVVVEQTQQLDELFSKSAVKGLENTPVGNAMEFGLNLLTGRKSKSLAPETPVEIPTEVKPQVKPETKPEVKPQVKPETKPEVKPDAKLKPDANVKPEANIKPQTKAKPEGKVKPSWIPSLGITPGQSVTIGNGRVIGVNDYKHRPAAPMPYLNAIINDSVIIPEENADEQRRKIENVPRPNSDRNKAMARNESIKKKIIDENVKKKSIIKNAIDSKYSKSVEIAPEIKSEKMNEASTNPKPSILSGLSGGVAGFGAGATLGAMYGDQMQQATNKALAPTDKFNPLLQKGTRDPATGEYKLDPSAKGWGYDQTSVRDVLDTATFGAYPKIRAGVDTAVKTWNKATGAYEPTVQGAVKAMNPLVAVGSAIANPSRTLNAIKDIPKQYDIEQKQEKEKRDPANATGRNTSLTNPENIGLDTLGNVMQAVPYRPVQLAGTALAGARSMGRGDSYNALLDIGGGLNPVPKLIGNTTKVKRFFGNALDQFPNALQAGQAGKAYYKDIYLPNTEPIK